MSETIKIGKNEYDIDKPWTATTQDLQLALNELAQLRQERDDLQKRVKELEDTIELGVIEFHTPKNSELQDKFYEVVEDLRLSGSIVDVWLMDIATTLKRHGYTMTIRRNKKESPDEV